MHRLKSTRRPSILITKVLVQNSKAFMGCLILLTLILIIPASRVSIDTSGVSFNTVDSDRYKEALAFIVKIDNEILNGFELEKQVKQMKQIIVAAFPEHPHCYAAGIPILRAAFERYNLLNAVVFGSLGLFFDPVDHLLLPAKGFCFQGWDQPWDKG